MGDGVRARSERLAERLVINEAQVSKDERNQHHGISVERVHDALDGEVTVSVRLQASVDTAPRTPTAR